MDSSFVVGSRVALRDLTTGSHLNGKKITLGTFNRNSSRWAVDVDGVGFKSIKPDNMRQVSSDVARKKRLCRYGNLCHRPDCWYQHTDSLRRCESFAAYWQRLRDDLRDVVEAGVNKRGESCESPPSGVASVEPLASQLSRLASDVSAHSDK